MTQSHNEHNDVELRRLIESATAPADASAASSGAKGAEAEQLRAAWLALGTLIERAGMAANKPPAALEELASRKPDDLPRPRSLEPTASPARLGRKPSRTHAARWRRLQWVFSAAVVLLIMLWAFPRLYQLNPNGRQPGPAKVATVAQPENGQPQAGAGSGTTVASSSQSPNTSKPVEPTVPDSGTNPPAAHEPSRAVATTANDAGESIDPTEVADQLAWDDQLDEMIWAAAEATAQFDYAALAQTTVLSDRLDQLRLDLEGDNF